MEPPPASVISINDAKKRRRKASNGAPPPGGTPPGAGATWRSELIYTERGNPKAHVANAIVAFRKAPEWRDVLAFNEFANRSVMRSSPPWPDEAAIPRDWTAADDIRAAEWLQHQQIDVSPEVAAQAIEVVARDRPFHPVKEKLDALVWDGEHRLDAWMITYLGAEDTEYCRAVGARWTIQAVARIYEPGVKADCVLILEGPQGILKSTALRKLGDPWFADEVAELGTKDAALQAAGVWIIELSELEGMTRAAIAKTKAFLSRSVDRFRPPYGHRLVEIPRQCVFCGTTNSADYLRDETGARRFWPIACTKIDIGGLEAARDLLWAEARERYLAGEAWWLDSKKLVQAAAEEQEARRQHDPWQQEIEQFIHNNEAEGVTVGDILRGALYRTVDQWTQSDENRVAACLRALDWKRKQIRTGTRREWRYFPPPDVSPVSPVGKGDW